MKGRIDTVLFWTLSLISISGIIFGTVCDSRQRAVEPCHSVSVCIRDSATNKYATEREIVGIIDSLYGGYINVPAEDINLWKMEKILCGVDFMETATCYVTRNGVLHVEVTQTTPVAKFLGGGKPVYLSREGKCMNTREDWNDRIVKLSGSPMISNQKWLRDIGKCCGTFLGTSGLAERISSLECTTDGECTLLLAGRDERFLFGKPENTEKKLVKIFKYERNIAPGSYKTVDVRFKGQIICK